MKAPAVRRNSIDDGGGEGCLSRQDGDSFGKSPRHKLMMKSAAMGLGRGFELLRGYEVEPADTSSLLIIIK